MKAVTSEVMRGLDHCTINDYGVPGLELMERAGGSVAEIIISRFGNNGDRNVLILAGKGNNGGDGFVIARLLDEAGWHVSLLLFATVFSGDAEVNFRRIPSSVGKLYADNAAMTEVVENAEIIVDAIFGTGLTSGLSGIYGKIASLVNSSSKPVVSVDIPSGVDGTSGMVPGSAINADITVAFGAAKIGHILYPGAHYVGELIVADIGIPDALIDKAPYVEFIDHCYAANLIKPRYRTAHKGSFGHCLIVAGSCGKSGAAAMAANSAMRSGSGLVTLAVPAGIHQVVEVKTTESMTVPLSEGDAGCISIEAKREIADLLDARNAVLVGPGLGLDEGTSAVVEWILTNVQSPLVLDADALNAISLNLSSLKESSSESVVLTPHPGEMSRLTGLSIDTIESDRIGVARSFAVANKCCLILKGARTVIAAPDGRVAINSTGNPGMASGGMGDVLAGVVVSLLGQGYEPFTASCLAVFSHGMAGDLAVIDKGETGLIATDVQEKLPYAFKLLQE